MIVLKGNLILSETFVFLLLALNLAAGIIYYISFWLPYKRIKRMYHFAGKGRKFEELFHEEYMLFLEHEKVMQRFNELINRQDAISQSKRQAEYLALQNQINPHFLYNTLEAIRGDALYEGMTSIAETTEALASFFRYTITDVGNLVSLEGELENSQNYFTIQKYRFGEKLEMQIHFPENEPSLLQLLVPKLSLQPIIENAIFHGLENIKGHGLITINFETTTTRLFISIADNGIGIEPHILKKLNDDLEQVGVTEIREDKKKRGGIALKNVSRRIKLLFGDEYGLHLYSTPYFGTDTRLMLPKLTQRDIFTENADVLLQREGVFKDEK